jgi:hypothetical protein
MRYEKITEYLTRDVLSVDLYVVTDVSEETSPFIFRIPSVIAQ